MENPWKGAADWLRNNYHSYSNVLSICEAMEAAAPRRAAVMAGDLSEFEKLRSEQAAAVMPLIGPLLDAFEGAQRGDLEDVSTDLVRYLKAINCAMEGEDHAD